MESSAGNGTDLMENSGVAETGFDSSQIIGATAGLAGILGNGLVCFVMLRYRSAFSSITNKLMLHQSIVDFSLSTVMLITRLYTPWGQFYCRVPRGWLYWGLANVSTFSLMLICCDRYVAVCYAVKYRKWFSAKRVKIGLLFVWLLPVLWQSYLVLVHLPDGASCVAIWPNDTARLSFGVATFCWEYVLPLALIVVTYSQTILALRKRLRVKAEQAATEPSASHSRNAGNKARKDPLQTAKVRLTITFLVVAIFFVICWGPTEITWLLFNFGILPGSYYASLWHLGLETPLLCINTCVNPFIYCITYTQFRRHLCKAFCGGCKSNKVKDTSVEVLTENTSDPLQSTRGKGPSTATEVNT
ncbi:galanin receptor 2a-like [Patiria miniata]|uniref:G-protein coupled receptors family 1 profile domain-containing protein n=1 Tax=Patiria miniata TaxID=46514 RepID=A0A913ZTD0_PATMI|nr:galanin receptor 2a-like [Patiria miniata]